MLYCIHFVVEKFENIVIVQELMIYLAALRCGLEVADDSCVSSHNDGLFSRQTIAKQRLCSVDLHAAARGC